jgi:proteic killer suppression protein
MFQQKKLIFPPWYDKVSGNWRVTFQIDDGDVYNVDYEDYHH